MQSSAMSTPGTDRLGRRSRTDSRCMSSWTTTDCSGTKCLAFVTNPTDLRPSHTERLLMFVRGPNIHRNPFGARCSIGADEGQSRNKEKLGSEATAGDNRCGLPNGGHRPSINRMDNPVEVLAQQG